MQGRLKGFIRSICVLSSVYSSEISGSRTNVVWSFSGVLEDLGSSRKLVGFVFIYLGTSSTSWWRVVAKTSPGAIFFRVTVREARAKAIQAYTKEAFVHLGLSTSYSYVCNTCDI